MLEHTAPDPTELNSFGVLVVTSSEHFESSSKSDNSARRAVITSDHRSSTAQPHIVCSPTAALASSPPTSSVQAGRASVQSAAWASPTVLDWRLTTRCRCKSPSWLVAISVCRRSGTASSSDVFDVGRRPCSDSRHVTAPYKLALYYYYYY